MGANRNTEQRYKLYIHLLSFIKNQILLTVNIKQILLTVSKKQILLTVSKKQIFCVSIVSTLLLLAIFPLAKNRRFGPINVPSAFKMSSIYGGSKNAW